jgi:hypothetical protein
MFEVIMSNFYDLPFNNLLKLGLVCFLGFK